MKTNFDSTAIDSLERFYGLIIRPALLNARSPTAELADAVNKVRANGREALNRFSLKTLIPWPPTSAAENNANCFSTSSIVSCVDDWEHVLDADDMWMCISCKMPYKCRSRTLFFLSYTSTSSAFCRLNFLHFIRCELVIHEFYDVRHVFTVSVTDVCLCHKLVNLKT